MYYPKTQDRDLESAEWTSDHKDLLKEKEGDVSLVVLIHVLVKEDFKTRASLLSFCFRVKLN
jgi:hypothetical protein